MLKLLKTDTPIQPSKETGYMNDDFKCDDCKSSKIEELITFKPYSQTEIQWYCLNCAKRYEQDAND